MLDDRSKLREGLLATATFAAIALGTLGALDFIVTGGFDFGARRTASSYGSPLVGASVLAAEPPASTITAVTWSAPQAVNEEQTAEDLHAAEPGEGVAAPSEDQLYSEIAQLYLEQDARADEDQAMDAGERTLRGGVDEAPALYDVRDLRPDPNAPDSDR